MKRWILFLHSWLRRRFTKKSKIRQTISLAQEWLYPGCLAWCKMPLTERELKQVKPGHQIRPYLITKTAKDGYWGFYCSSKSIPSCRYTQIFVIPGKITKNRSSYVDLREQFYIPRENVLEKMVVLPEAVLIQLNKYLKIESQYRFWGNLFSFPVDFKLAVGDLLSDGSLIVEVHREKANAIMLSKKPDKNCEAVIIRGKRWYLLDQDCYEISIYKQSVIEIATFAEFQKIQSAYKTIQIIKKRKKNNGVKYRYSPGRILVKSKDGSHYVYLFDLKEHSYGYELNDWLPDHITEIKKKMKDTRKSIPNDSLKEDLEYCLSKENWSAENIHAVVEMIVMDLDKNSGLLLEIEACEK